MPRRVALLALIMLLALPAAATAEDGWQWPLRGELVTPYRNGNDPYAGGQHRGIDIGAAEGSKVLAATAGTVRFAGVAGDSGLTVSVRTADGRYDTSYLHLSAASVRPGQHIEGGQGIGAVGTTGRRSAVASHLHFGVREAGNRHAYHDPMDFLPPLPAPPREAPRGAPAPVTVPRPVAVVPERVGAPGRVRYPSGVGAPRAVRLPVGRRVRVPARRRLGRPGLARPPLPVHPLVPTARLGRHARVARGVEGARVPETGPQAAGTPQVEPSAEGRPTPASRSHGAPGSGPDVGWALACLGLLAAAACLGRPGGRDAKGARKATDLRGLVRPLFGGP